MARIWKTLGCLVLSFVLMIPSGCGGGGGAPTAGPCGAGGPPSVTLNTPAAGATQLTGYACNIDTSRIKVVIYVLTNIWYVQPFTSAPFTNISADGAWKSTTNPWARIVVLLVDPATYTAAAMKITHPALDSGIVASVEYPPTALAAVEFSGRTWGIKVSADRFDPGPNYWTNDPAIVHITSDGLHLRIAQLNGRWQCTEVYLLESLGYGTYTVQVATDLARLDMNTVAAPLFIYAAPGQEIDNEYGGPGGLIPAGNNAQFVVQPYTAPGNLVRYVHPSGSQLTTQMEWRFDRITFRSWTGWSPAPAPGDLIYEWIYTGRDIPPPGQERFRMNLWLLDGRPPSNGAGDEMVIKSFTYAP